MSSVYRSEPLGRIDDIPVFAGSDRYVENYQRIAADHLKAMKPEAANPWIPDALWREAERSTAELVRKHTRPGRPILDAGVGLGRVMQVLDGYQRFGIDISLDYLRVARDAGVDVAFARIENLPYQDNRFDTVVCTDVLEHVLDLNRCCSELLRVLRPGGTLVVRVPLEEDLSVYMTETIPYEFIHLRSFTLASLQLLFIKIFSCSFVEAMPVGLYLGDETRMKVRPLRQECINRIKKNLMDAFDGAEDSVLSRICSISQEDYVAWIHGVSRSSPELFDAVKGELVKPIEINIVVKKPFNVVS